MTSKVEVRVYLVEFLAWGLKKRYARDFVAKNF